MTLDKRIVLDLCGGTGSWSRPYAEAGYDVRLVTLPDQDVRTYQPPENVHGILAAPPCTEFAVSGARWWKSKPPALLEEAVLVVRACLRIIEEAKPVWWALENPAGRLKKFIGPPAYVFHPYEFGNPWTKKTFLWGKFRPPMKLNQKRPLGRWVKGNQAGQRNGVKQDNNEMCAAVTKPERWKMSTVNHLSPKPTGDQIARLVETGILPPDWVHRLGPSPNRAVLRSITPPGFARAFFQANP